MNKDSQADKPEPLRRRVRARLLVSATAALRFLPPPVVGLGFRMLAALARQGKLGRQTRANLIAVYGKDQSSRERATLVRAIFRHSARQLTEWVRLAGGALPDSERGAWIEEAVVFDPSIEILERALAGGKGVIVVTPHLGNWELLAAALRRKYCDGAVVGLTRKRDSSFDWLVNMRQSYGVTTISQDSPPRRILQVLRAGQTLGLLSDLEVRRLDGEFLPFLGRPALTMTAPAAMARAARLPLLPIRCVASKQHGGRYLLSVEEPLHLDPDLPRRAATIELTKRVNACFERWIRDDPEQWAWHQNRWRTAPGEYDAVPLVERSRRIAERKLAAGKTASQADSVHQQEDRNQ